MEEKHPYSTRMDGAAKLRWTPEMVFWAAVMALGMAVTLGGFVDLFLVMEERNGW